MDHDGPETGGIETWWCPLCATLTLYAEWERHVREEHPGYVVKEVHPTAQGHA